MALSIKSDEADRLARALAEKTGESLTEVVTQALRERLHRQTGRREPQQLLEDLRAIRKRCSALPRRDDRTPEEICYDERGLPR